MQGTVRKLCWCCFKLTFLLLLSETPPEWQRRLWRSSVWCSSKWRSSDFIMTYLSVRYKSKFLFTCVFAGTSTRRSQVVWITRSSSHVCAHWVTTCPWWKKENQILNLRPYLTLWIQTGTTNFKVAEFSRLTKCHAPLLLLLVNSVILLSF